jgi:hypothetical protein
MDLSEMVCDVCYIYLSQDRLQQWTFMNTIMKLCFQEEMVYLLTSKVTIRITRLLTK